MSDVEPLKRGDRVQVSQEGIRCGIQARRHGVLRIGTIIRRSGESIDVRWDGVKTPYSIHMRFLERVPPECSVDS